MKRSLNYPYFFPRFLAPDTGGGEGGGGAAAVLEAPTEQAAPADPNAAELLSYTPPGADSIADLITGDAESPGAPDKPAGDGKKAAETPTPAPEKKDDAPAADGKKTKEQPAALMRKRIGELETERTELQKQLEAAKSDKRVEDLTAQIQAKDKAITERERQLADTERKLLIHNPLVSKQLTELADGFNRDFAQAVASVPALKTQYRPLLDELEAITGTGDDYADNLRNFKAKLKETFDDDSAEVLQALRKGLKFREDHARVAEEVQTNAAKIEFEERKKAWEEGHKRFETEFDKWLEPPADAAANDPLNHKLFLRRFDEAMPKEEVEKVNHNIKVFLDRLFNGATPRTKDDFPGMTPEQAAAEMARIEKTVRDTREMAPGLIAVGLKLAAYARPIFAQLQKLQEQVKERKAAAPPDPTRSRESGERREEDDDMPSPDAVAAGME